MQHQVILRGRRRRYYSPLRYPGGKTILYPFFERKIVESGLTDVTYVEPFAGGAGAAIALLLNESIDRIVINDLDKALYAFWRSAVFESERLIEAIERTPVTVKEWRKQKAIYENKRAKGFERGFATFFLNRTNLSGILNGGPIGGLDQTGKWKIDARYNKPALIERIRTIAEYRGRITVTNEDGVELVGRYLRHKNTFVYLDPPYYEKAADLYLNFYVERDHARLAKKLNAHPDAPWLLTYDDRPEILKLYPNRKALNFSLSYNAYERRRGHELMILSDRLA
ncbi:MAG TPA: DNA adenine methylase [Thermoanaerobaculia bacterium]|nr:DNA adenine methylase [Thermoanaerobaculia bacterium]